MKDIKQALTEKSFDHDPFSRSQYMKKMEEIKKKDLNIATIDAHLEQANRMQERALQDLEKD